MKRFMKLLNVVIRYPGRLFNGISLRATVVDSVIDKTAKVQNSTNIRYSSIGKYSYVAKNTSIIHAQVGSFCSIAGGVSVGGGAHNMYAVSTSPVFQKGHNIFNMNFANINFEPFKKTIIGDDVWIGNRAIVLQGVIIGNGSIVGAGSVVTRDIPPYEIWAGNPAKMIRKRFDDETIKKLTALQWWNWSDEKIIKYAAFFDNPNKLINTIKEVEQ